MKRRRIKREKSTSEKDSTSSLKTLTHKNSNLGVCGARKSNPPVNGSDGLVRECSSQDLTRFTSLREREVSRGLTAKKIPAICGTIIYLLYTVIPD